ncbi:hypothetical protein, partial [Bacillus pumilus]|uniref:hypothetical protein n=1 Tax=Bacillus pumilus TaxID=1408 RepID=UPI0021B23973
NGRYVYSYGSFTTKHGSSDYTHGPFKSNGHKNIKDNAWTWRYVSYCWWRFNDVWWTNGYDWWSSTLIFAGDIKIR